MFQTVKRLREQGMTIIYISHRLDEIFDLADNVTVLRDGCRVRTMPVKDVTRHDLVTMMVGREVVNEYPKETIPLAKRCWRSRTSPAKACSTAFPSICAAARCWV